MEVTVIPRTRVRPYVTLLLSLTAIGSACSFFLVDPTLPAGTAQYTAPPVYARWWAITEACSGLTGPLSTITFYQVPNPNTALPGTEDAGYWSKASNRIVVIADDTLDGSLVRHEMLHALLRGGGHPRDQFMGRCAGVVVCDTSCVTDGGPPPPPDPLAVVVPPDSLQIGADLEPDVAGVPNPPAYFTIAVTARNPTSHLVIVSLPAGTQSGLLAGFGLTVSGATGGLGNEDLAVDPSSWTFAPGETKRRLFDYVVGPANPGDGVFPPGPTIARGQYGRSYGPIISFVLLQP
jgi:hypothetical protein